MLIDTHCHLDAAEFDADREAVHAAARAAGVETIVVPAVEVSAFARTRETVLGDSPVRAAISATRSFLSIL